MTSETVWVVEGSTGEYSDRRDWAVCAFTGKAKAEALVVSLTQAAGKAGMGSDDVPDWRSREEIREALHTAGDPGADIDYTGVRYTCYELEVRA